LEQLVSEYNSGLSTCELERKYNYSQSMVSYLFRRNGIKMRKKWEHRTINISNSELSEEQKQIIDGCVFGDGSISTTHSGISSYFSLTTIHKEFAEHLKAVISLPFREKLRCRKSRQIVIRGKEYKTKESYELISRTDKSLTSFRKRWYPNGIKIIPPDLELTPLCMKYWFYGDGCASFVKYKDIPDAYVRINFCTNCFTIPDCELLQSKLEKIGLKFAIYLSSRNQPIFVTLKTSTVLDFFDYMGECTVPCFEYKWKKPSLKMKRKTDLTNLLA
jgi:hypothetical protein